MMVAKLIKKIICETDHMDHMTWLLFYINFKNELSRSLFIKIPLQMSLQTLKCRKFIYTFIGYYCEPILDPGLRLGANPSADISDSRDFCASRDSFSRDFELFELRWLVGSIEFTRCTPRSSPISSGCL